ncbi:MAG: PRC-barrel domain-containing protein [Anaerolineaceae bacterium]
MKKLSVLSILVVASMLLAACSAAATPTATETVAATEAPVVTEAPVATETAAATETEVATEVSIDRTDQGKVSKLIGFTVKSMEGKDIAQVSDLLINAATSRVDYVVVNTLPDLGIDAATVLIPFMTMTLPQEGADPMAFYFTMEDAVLKHAPVFDPATDINTADWDKAYKAYWNTYTTDMIGDLPAPAEGAPEITPMPAATTTLLTIKASQLLNVAVADKGTIAEIDIDQVLGNVLDVVVSDGTNATPTPMSGLTIAAGADALTVSAN